MARASSKNKARRPANTADTQPGEPSRGRRIATVVISLILVIGLGLPVAGLGFASCAANAPITVD